MLDISSNLPGKKRLDLGFCAQQATLAEIGFATALAMQGLDHILMELLQISISGREAVSVLPFRAGKNGDDAGGGAGDAFGQFS